MDCKKKKERPEKQSSAQNVPRVRIHLVVIIGTIGVNGIRNVMIEVTVVADWVTGTTETVEADKVFCLPHGRVQEGGSIRSPSYASGRGQTLVFPASAPGAVTHPYAAQQSGCLRSIETDSEPKFGFSHSPSGNPITPIEVNGAQIEILVEQQCLL